MDGRSPGLATCRLGPPPNSARHVTLTHSQRHCRQVSPPPLPLRCQAVHVCGATTLCQGRPHAHPRADAYRRVTSRLRRRPCARRASRALSTWPPRFRSASRCGEGPRGRRVLHAQHSHGAWRGGGDGSRGGLGNGDGGDTFTEWGEGQDPTSGPNAVRAVSYRVGSPPGAPWAHPGASCPLPCPCRRRPRRLGAWSLTAPEARRALSKRQSARKTAALAPAHPEKVFGCRRRQQAEASQPQTDRHAEGPFLTRSATRRRPSPAPAHRRRRAEANADQRRVLRDTSDVPQPSIPCICHH